MKLAFREIGQGPPLIILHGLFGQSDNWNSLAKKISENGLRVFTLDLRNHGLSPHSSAFNYQVMANDLKEFIDTYNLKNPILLGHSMGGKVILFFELLYAKISSKLIIVDIATRAYLAKHHLILKALNSVDFNLINNRKDVELILNELITEVGVKQFLLKNIYWQDSENKILNWRFNLKAITANYELINIEVPKYTSKVNVLIIRGENSDYLSNNDLSDYLSFFKNCKSDTIKNSGHWVHAENPTDFLKSILSFISN